MDSQRHPNPTAIAAVNYALALAALILLLVYAQVIVIASLIGIGIGVILAPTLKRLQRRHNIPRTASAAMVTLILLALVGGVGYGMLVIAGSQIASLHERMPEFTASLQGKLDGWSSRYPWLGQLSDGASSLDVSGALRTVGTKLFKGAWSGFSILAALLFAFVIGVYTAVEIDSYHRGLVQALPPRRRSVLAPLLPEAAATVRNWFNAQLIDMGIIATLTSLGLWLAGIDYWLLFGLLTGLLGIIPYAGIAIVVIFASLVTLASDAGRLPWVIGVFIITQQLEGHLILPLVMRGRAQLPAVPLLIFMLLLGSWGGLLGVLMAPPLFAVLLLGYRRLYLPGVGADGAADPAVADAPAVEGSSRREQRRNRSVRGST